MTHTFTWRCTACPRPRTTVETTEDTPPVCPTCGKVMKTTDCCGVSGASPYATPGPFYLQPGEKHPSGWVWAKQYKRKLNTPDYLEPVFNAEMNTKPGGTVSFVAGPQHDPKRCGCGVCIRRRSNPEPMPDGDYEVEQFTHVGGRRVSLGRYLKKPSLFTSDVVDLTDPAFLSTNLERRLDVTERLLRELTERLYPVTAGDVGTEVVSDCSPMGERVERINASLGRLLGGLDLP